MTDQFREMIRQLHGDWTEIDPRRFSPGKRRPSIWKRIARWWWKFKRRMF